MKDLVSLHTNLLVKLSSFTDLPDAFAAGLFSSLMLVGKARAYPKVGHL